MDNTDTFLQLLSQRDGTYLEVVLPDLSTRFTHVVSVAPGPIIQPAGIRSAILPLTAPWGTWWEGGQESTQAVSGASAVVVGGTQPVYDAIIEFSGDGTFEHTVLGWEITITGSSGAVTVDLGNRTVTEGGLPATALMTRVPVVGDGRVWGWFTQGSNSVTSTVATTVTWRDQWL